MIAQSRNFVTGIANDKLRLYGLQFHPEVDLTVNGKAMLRSFLFDVAGLTPNFTMESREAACIRYIREKVGTNKVLVSKLKFFWLKMHHKYNNYASKQNEIEMLLYKCF